MFPALLQNSILFPQSDHFYIWKGPAKWAYSAENLAITLHGGASSDVQWNPSQINLFPRSCTSWSGLDIKWNSCKEPLFQLTNLFFATCICYLLSWNFRITSLMWREMVYSPIVRSFHFNIGTSLFSFFSIFTFNSLALFWKTFISISFYSFFSFVSMNIFFFLKTLSW